LKAGEGFSKSDGQTTTGSPAVPIFTDSDLALQRHNMNKDRKKEDSAQSACTALPGTSAEGGRSINPKDLPEGDDSPVYERPYSIPIGLPIKDEEYDRLKEEAKREQPATDNIGQQDSNA
jgi:hypothetical protein